jgi:c-di-AMP phosphodiesterase-like protein
MYVQCKLKEYSFIGLIIIYILLNLILDSKSAWSLSILIILINYIFTDTTICLEEKLNRRYARNL